MKHLKELDFFFHSKGLNAGLPWGPVVKTESCHCRGTGSISGQGTKTLHTSQCSCKTGTGLNASTFSFVHPQGSLGELYFYLFSYYDY